ncbi:MAG: hypothetical protein LQ346_006165 [Caloplaca aetnensis]|nr:MAG: hypothetical protein LQ346_006165 [Caloplaca aetnensis]
MHLLSSSSSSSSSLLLLPILTTLIALRSASAERTEFPASPATCANSNADLPYVIVQPLCDSAIAVICNVTVDRYTNSSSLDRYRAVGEVAIGACEAQIIFPEPRPTFTWDVNTCVKAFQEITINCMLLRRRWSAKEPGQQAGISGLAFDDQLGFSALDATGPGYLVGPPTYYGDIGAVNLTDLVPGNAKPA